MFRRGFVGLLVAAAVSVTGCGSSLVKTEGVVNLDGQPVDGATVTFTTEDGTHSYSGLTDAAGKFSMRAEENRVGIPAGSYKVIVIKTPKVAGSESMVPGSPEYLKQMEKSGKEAAKSKSGLAMYQKSTGNTIKSELPTVYASAASSPLSAKVPSDKPIVLDLKSKP